MLSFVSPPDCSTVSGGKNYQNSRHYLGYGPGPFQISSVGKQNRDLWRSPPDAATSRGHRVDSAMPTLVISGPLGEQALAHLGPWRLWPGEPRHPSCYLPPRMADPSETAGNLDNEERLIGRHRNIAPCRSETPPAPRPGHGCACRGADLCAGGGGRWRCSGCGALQRYTLKVSPQGQNAPLSGIVGY